MIFLFNYNKNHRDTLLRTIKHACLILRSWHHNKVITLSWQCYCCNKMYCHIVITLSSKCWSCKKIKKNMYKKHCFTQGLTKVIILLVICDISFCYNFVMKMFVIWPCFLVHTFKTSRLKSLTTSSRVPHYLVQVPRKCIQCY